ncbi:MAG: FAD-dependent oxidoreductase [Bacteroidia bacterium]|jgi:protoporphyrinogen oxidase|nr:FAD-dependent oxidoreductase [Bacteroidia bacterium]
METQTHETIAIIGAGPAGLTAAYQLTKAGKKVHVYEASHQIGGLCKSLKLWGNTLDLGPHRFFSDDTRVNELWLEVVGKDYLMVDRLTRIYYKKHFYQYPIKIADALSKLGIFTSASCFFSYVFEKVKPTQQDGSFQNWVVSRFGYQLFAIFFKTYSEKLWGIACTDLDADFAAQRIKKFTLGEAIKKALGFTVNHKTLVDQFAYPLGGTGMVYERMSAFIAANGGKVFVNTPIQKIAIQNGQAIGVVNQQGETIAYSHVVSTMPLSVMVKQLNNVPTDVVAQCNQLTFRNTIIVYLRVQGENLFPDNWLYVHSEQLKMGRITNFGNWVPSIVKNDGTTVLALEYWCYDQDLLWSQEDESIIELAKYELNQTGLNQSNAILNGYVHRIHRCYPVYKKGYKEHLKPIKEYLNGIGRLSVIGRYGSFKYNNQDHSILMGLLAAENIIKNTKHNLWEINTDYDNYQEKSAITATGLQHQ